MRLERLTRLFAALSLSATLSAFAQAGPTASKSMDISVFGTYQFVKPDFGPYNNTGGSIGFDVTRYYPRLPVAVSLEARGNYSTGNSTTERAVLGGLRVKKDFRRWHPYGDLLVGGGTVKFSSTLAPAYTSDKGIVYSFGGGVDIDVLYHFQVKLDVQSQHYNLGAKSSANPSSGTFDLSPVGYGAGLSYVIPFRDHRKR